MKKFLTVVVSILLLGGAYIYSFGPPEPVAALMPADELGGEGAARDQTRPEGEQRRAGGERIATTVVTSSLGMQSYANAMTAVGTARAHRSVDITAEVTGAIVETNLVANTNVAAEDVLLRLDDRTQRLDLEIAQTEMDQARATLERYRTLAATGNATITDVTLAEAEFALRLAEANVGLMQIALEDRTIHAPIAGRLGMSTYEVGDLLMANTPIVTVDDDTALLIEFELPERALGMISQIETVEASTPTLTGRVFTGEIVAFDSRLDDITRSVTVQVRLENTDRLLWPGMTFAVRLTDESDPLPVVPATAITWSRGGAAVWIDDDGVAAQLPVTILFRQNDTVWLDGDIAVGTPVVVEGAQKLRAGEPITTPDAEQPARPDPAERSQPNPDGDA